MILADGLIPFSLNLESYLVFDIGHKVEHCHQLCLLLVHFFCVKPQGAVKLAFSVFSGIPSPFACKKGKLD